MSSNILGVLGSELVTVQSGRREREEKPEENCWKEGSICTWWLTSRRSLAIVLSTRLCRTVIDVPFRAVQEWGWLAIAVAADSGEMGNGAMPLLIGPGGELRIGWWLTMWVRHAVQITENEVGMEFRVTFAWTESSGACTEYNRERERVSVLLCPLEVLQLPNNRLITVGVD